MKEKKCIDVIATVKMPEMESIWIILALNMYLKKAGGETRWENDEHRKKKNWTGCESSQETMVQSPRFARVSGLLPSSRTWPTFSGQSDRSTFISRLFQASSGVQVFRN